MDCFTFIRAVPSIIRDLKVQSALDIATFYVLDVLLIATSIAIMSLRQYIIRDLGFNDLKFQLSCSKIAAVNHLEVAISNGLCFYALNFAYIFGQISFGNREPLNPLDGGQSLYSMSTVLSFFNSFGGETKLS